MFLSNMRSRRGASDYFESGSVCDPAMINAVVADLEDEGIVFSAALGNIDQYIDGTLYAEPPYTIAVSNFSSRGTRSLVGLIVFGEHGRCGARSGTWSLAIPEGLVVWRD